MVYSGCSNCNLFVDRFVVGMLDNTGDGYAAGSLVSESFEGLLVSRHIEEDEHGDGLALLVVVLPVAY